MKVDITIVSGLTPDSHPSVLLTIDSDSYLFGIPAELPRIALNGFKIERIKQFFALTTNQDQMGGFLTSTIQFYIPKGNEMYATMPKTAYKCLFYGVMDSFDYKKVSSFSFADENIAITPIELSKSTAYGVSIKDAPGQFDIKKAKELKIPPGPLFGKLTNGETVTLEDGRVIKPSDVVGCPRKIGKMLFIYAY